MKSEKISTEIAALERKVKSAKNAVVKKVLEKKIDSLRQELKKEEDGVSKLAKAKKKIREMSESDFNKFIKNLSKKEGFSFLKSMTKDEIKRDIQRTAKPVGWRFRGDNTKKPTRRDIREGNDVYYEARRNRSDVSRAVKLAEGGGVNADENLFSKGEVLFLFKGNKAEDFYESLTNMMPDHEITMVNDDKVQAFFGNYSDLEDAMQMAKSMGMTYQGKYEHGGGIGISVSEFEKKIKDLMKQENKWHFVNEVVDGKTVRMKFYVGKKEVDVQIFTIDNLGARMPRNYSGKRDTVGMIMENFGSKMEWGGTAESSETGDFIGGENQSSMYAKGGSLFDEPHRTEMSGMMAKGGGVNSNTYKLRAEGLDDFLAFLRTGMYMKIKSFTVEPIGVPDVVVSFVTDASLSEIKSKLKEVRDSHVMLETIKPINQYTGERE